MQGEEMTLIPHVASAQVGHLHILQSVTSTTSHWSHQILQEHSVGTST